MSDHAEIRYIEPLDQTRSKARKTPLWRRPVVVAAMLVIALPTVVSSAYYLLIASPRYVSETNFVVRRAGQAGPSALGLTLSGVGLSPTATDAFIVHEFTQSRSVIGYLKQHHDITNIFSPASADPFSRAISPWQEGNSEEVYKGVQRFITVGYDSTTGISTLRVEAFSPKDAQNVARTLLAGGENIVNTINDRSSRAAIDEAQQTVREASERLKNAQDAVTAFRNTEQIVDPELVAKASAELIGGLMGELATLEAERRQIMRDTPSSPVLPTLNQRIEAYRQQIAEEREKVAGASNSLAPKIATYEELMFERELATKTLSAANQALESARVDARRQHLFLDRVVEPNLPDSTTEPRRFMAILTVFASCLLIFGCGFLLWAGIREHRHE